MAKAGEAAEQEDVTDRIKVCLGFGQLKVADAAHFFLCKINDFLLGGLQGRLERLISHGPEGHDREERFFSNKLSAFGNGTLKWDSEPFVSPRIDLSDTSDEGPERYVFLMYSATA